MNLQFLGDALDHWKGSVFEELQKSNLLYNFKVDLLASDANYWQQKDYNIFSQLLRIFPDQIIAHQHTLQSDRKSYFQEIPGYGDLFLDPDTGIKTGSVKDEYQYLFPSELFNLLNKDNKRLIIVYQHVRAQKVRNRVEQVLNVLQKHQSTYFCTSYDSGTVSLLFFSLDRQRIQNITAHYRAFLGRHADNRIGQWI